MTWNDIPENKKKARKAEQEARSTAEMKREEERQNWLRDHYRESRG